jgi:hypothetical protein
MRWDFKEVTMGTLVALVVGVVVGWHIPMPPWAKPMVDKVVAWAKIALALVKKG